MAPMDWTKLISDLKETGLNQAEMAIAVGCAQSTLSDLATGEITQPRWPIASALVDLHKKRMRIHARRQPAKA